MISRFALVLCGCLPVFAVEFLDVTAKAGLAEFVNRQGNAKKDYILESIGGGAAWIDFDKDGWQDVLLVSGETVCALFRNQRDGTFQKVPLTAKGMGMGVAVGDYDGDGWDDFLITGYGRNWLFRNQQGKGWEEVAERAGVLSQGLWSTGATFFDYDNDGHADLFVARYVKFDISKPVQRSSACQYQSKSVFCGPQGFQSDPHSLYRNNGNGTFREVSKEAGIRTATGPHHGMGVISLDYDNDGRPDIYVANDDTPNQLWRNLGNGKFKDIAVEAGVAFSPDGLSQSSMGVDAGDLFHRGVQDIFVTTFEGQPYPLYKGGKDGFFEDVTWASGLGRETLPFLGWGANFLDLDNDGWLDIFMVNGHVYPEMGGRYRQKPLIFRNLRNGKFTEWPLLASALPGRGAAIGDFDNDGDLDILINNIDASPVLYENRGKPAGNWITVEAPVGARITVRTNGMSQFGEARSSSGYLSSSDRRMHFGLGEAAAADEIQITYVGGRRETLKNVKANQRLSRR
ncbi:MAG: CRTAC1 family protein [Bryobacterales bacterium]|nr:CRTAC1 family protein [Bryobacterales bacterium]